jgi:hypothetical protein
VGLVTRLDGSEHKPRKDKEIGKALPARRFPCRSGGACGRFQSPDDGRSDGNDPASLSPNSGEPVGGFGGQPAPFAMDDVPFGLGGGHRGERIQPM